MKTLWSEKYRPKSLNELDCSPHVRKFLETAIVSGFPHLLLYGPPGSGKTTAASLLGPTLELNASDERGIDVIRNKVKKVANTVAPQVILLDECENLTRDSQTCLRRVLEDYPNTRFIFCTNYYSKIIDPLKSRLLKIKFVQKKSNALERIGEKEGLGKDKEFYVELFKKCNGDIRRCLNIMQGLLPLANGSIKNDLIDTLIGKIPEKIIMNFMQLTEKERVKFMQDFLFEGYSVLQLVRQLNNQLCINLIEDQQISKFAWILGESEAKCLIGCSEEIVMEYLTLSYLMIIKTG